MQMDKQWKNDFTFIFSGGQSHRHGVGLIMNNSIAKSLSGFWPVSDRIIIAKLISKPFNIFLIQVYAPTQEHEDEVVERFYAEVESCLQYAKSDDIVCIMGDFNARVGSGELGKAVGKYGLGSRDERGERLIQFCLKNNLTVTNTWFNHHPRRLYTWIKPGDTGRSQIDFILMKQRFRNTVKNVKTYPGADIYSDHNPVIMKIAIKLKIPAKKKSQRKSMFDLEMLQSERTQIEYNIEIANRFEVFNENEPVQSIVNEEVVVESKWQELKDCINSSLKAVLPKLIKTKSSVWMTDEILNMMEKRKKAAHSDRSEYKRLHRKITGACRKAQDEWLKKQCKEIEQLEKDFEVKKMHKKVREMTGNSKKRMDAYGIKMEMFYSIKRTFWKDGLNMWKSYMKMKEERFQRLSQMLVRKLCKRRLRKQSKG